MHEYLQGLGDDHFDPNSVDPENEEELYKLGYTDGFEYAMSGREPIGLTHLNQNIYREGFQDGKTKAEKSSPRLRKQGGSADPLGLNFT